MIEVVLDRNMHITHGASFVNQGEHLNNLVFYHDVHWVRRGNIRFYKCDHGIRP